METIPKNMKLSENQVENCCKSRSAADLKIPCYLNQEKPYRVGNYLIKNTLGSGTFGKVKLGIYIPTKEKVAIKIIEKSKMTEKDDLVRLEREFEMLAQFNHPNLIMVSEIFESDNNYYTVMDYCEEGELFNYIVKNKYLSEEESAFFYYQLINGLEYIHSLGIVHRDLKPENLLLTKDHILKIIDFGLSNYFKEGQSRYLYTPCGSPCYASPEMVTGNSYDGIMIDVWSTGIILFAMLCGYLPFEDKNNEKLFKKIAECKIEYPEYISEEAKDLMKQIIVPNPKERITINDIKKHNFYKRGKQLFDKEFTIQFISDVDFTNNKNKENDKKEDNKSNNVNVSGIRFIDKIENLDTKDNTDEAKSNLNKKEEKEEKEDIYQNKNDKKKEAIIIENNSINIDEQDLINDSFPLDSDNNLHINKNSKIKNDSNENSIYKNNNNVLNNIDINDIINKDENINNYINNNNNDNQNININNSNISIKNKNEYIINGNNNIFISNEESIIGNNHTSNAGENIKIIEENSNVNNNENENIKIIDENNISDKINDNNKDINGLNSNKIMKMNKKISIDDIKNNNVKKRKKKIKIKNKNINNNNNNSINNKQYKISEISNENREENINSMEKNVINKNNENKRNEKIKNKAISINSFDSIINTNNNNSKSIDKFENSNKSYNTKKTNYKNGKNYLLIEKLNNSVDNKKIGSIGNNNIQNLCLNNIISPKENENIYQSNTFACNTKKEKEKFKSNKLTNNMVGKILKINIIQESKKKLQNQDICKKLKREKEKNRKNEEDINKKLINKRNTFCAYDLKSNDSLKTNEKKLSLQKKKKFANIKNKLTSLTSNYHKYTISTDINSNFVPLEIKNKKRIHKNIDEIQNMESNIGGNKSVRQDFCPMGLTKKNLKINSNLSLKNKNIYLNNKNINDFYIDKFIQESSTLKTEANEYTQTDNDNGNGVISVMEQNSKRRLKWNNNLLKIEPRQPSKDSSKAKPKRTFYKIRNVVGIFSSNNLRHLKKNNNHNNENNSNSHKKSKIKNKLNIWRNDNINKYNSENKIKKFNKIFIQQKINDIISNNSNNKSNFSNYNNSNTNMSNAREKRSTISKNKSKKNIDKKIIFTNKYSNYYIEDGFSSLENNHHMKININNNINTKLNSLETPKNKNTTKLVKKNKNYIRIKRKIDAEMEKKRKNISKNKTKIKQKSIEESFNLKEFKNSNTMRNPFHQTNKSSLWGEDKKIFKKQKLNIKKNISDKINNNSRLVKNSKTFINFNIHKLSYPKIKTVSPKYKKYINFISISDNININNNKSNNNHFRQNTLPGTMSPPQKFIRNNFINIQQNIIDNLDNKLFNYTNTEYEQYDSMSKNMKKKLFNKKYKSICNVLNSNINKNRIMNANK